MPEIWGCFQVFWDTARRPSVTNVSMWSFKAECCQPCRVRILGWPVIGTQHVVRCLPVQVRAVKFQRRGEAQPWSQSLCAGWVMGGAVLMTWKSAHTNSQRLCPSSPRKKPKGDGGNKVRFGPLSCWAAGRHTCPSLCLIITPHQLTPVPRHSKHPPCYTFLMLLPRPNLPALLCFQAQSTCQLPP